MLFIFIRSFLFILRSSLCFLVTSSCSFSPVGFLYDAQTMITTWKWRQTNCIYLYLCLVRLLFSYYYLLLLVNRTECVCSRHESHGQTKTKKRSDEIEKCPMLWCPYSIAAHIIAAKTIKFVSEWRPPLSPLLTLFAVSFTRNGQ